MSIKINTITSDTTTLTPSTIQCTKFERSYSNSLLDMKRYLYSGNKNDRKTNQFSKKKVVYSMPIISTTACSYEVSAKPINLIHRSTSTFTCLDKNMAKKIQRFLPKRISISTNWSLVYSLDQHGASLNTLYNKCLNCGPCLLIIQNDHNEVFGAYLSEGIHIESSYYGTGECFLWKLNNDTKQVIPYHWSMMNDYMIYSNHDFFAIGGGQGKFGLWLNSDLMHGYTQPCITFNNTNLCRKSAFNCIALEIWDFAF